MYKYLFFDAANTLIHKPDLFLRMEEVLDRHGYRIPGETIRRHHKFISESVLFPDRTDRAFYESFNAEFLFSLGIIPEKALLGDLFEACSYLPWKAFDDTAVLHEIDLPKGIVSNFNRQLGKTLEELFGNRFSNVVVSEEADLRKPDERFYRLALQSVDVAPEEIIYVGDSLKLDMQPALAVGMRAVLIDRDNLYPYYRDRISSLSMLKNLLNP